MSSNPAQARCTRYESGVKHHKPNQTIKWANVTDLLWSNQKPLIEKKTDITMAKIKRTDTGSQNTT